MVYQKDKSSESKVKCRQASKRVLAKGFLILPNLHMQIKQKSPLFPRNLALKIFGKLPLVFSTKVNLLYYPLCNSPELLSSASDKVKLLAEKFSKNSNPDDSGISLPAFDSRTNLKLHIFL